MIVASQIQMPVQQSLRNNVPIIAKRHQLHGMPMAIIVVFVQEVIALSDRQRLHNNVPRIVQREAFPEQHGAAIV